MAARWGLLLCLVGCVPATPADGARPVSARAYTCSGHPEPAPPPVPKVDAPVGRLEIAVTDGTSKPPEASLQGLAPRRIRIVAEAVPLGSLAAALADRLGVAIAVDAEVVNVRV